MTANLGNLDRVIRLVLGIALILAPLVYTSALWDSSVLKYGAIVVGLVLAGTSAMRFCPLYRIFGINTCRR